MSENTNEFEDAVLEAQASLAKAGADDAFARDPYRDVLAGLSVTLGVLVRFVRLIEATNKEPQAGLTAADVQAAVDRGVERLESATKQVSAAPLPPAAIDAISRSLRGAAHEWGREAGRSIRHQILRGAALVGAGIATAAFCGGFAAGWMASGARIAAERVKIEIAAQHLTLPLPQAEAWTRLIENNTNVLSALSQTPVQKDSEGRRSGAVPLWLEPPKPAAPPH